MFNRAPSWVLKGARYDLDFANSRYWGGPINLGQGTDVALYPPSLITGGAAVAVASTLFCPDSSGILRTFPISAARITSGVGLWVEATTTNYMLQCRDMTNASWVKSASMTATKTGILGADGTTGNATKLTAGAANQTVTQAITLTSRELISSCYIKRVTGSGAIYISEDNGLTKTDVSGSINSTSFTLVQLSASQTLADPTAYIEIATSGDEIIADFWQTENSTYPTTRILTTTTTRSRAGGGTDMPQFNNTTTSRPNEGIKVINDTMFNTPMSVFAIYSGNGATGHVVKGGGATSTTKLTGGADGGPAVFINATSGNNGTAAGANIAAGIGPINKAAGMVNGFGCRVCLNGDTVVGGSTAITPGGTDTHIGIGNNGAGALYLGGYISRLTLWNKEITDGDMTYWTTPGTVGGL